MSGLRAGVARTFVTPAPGTPLAGYAERLGNCTGARDELTGTALVLDDGDTRLGVVALDLLAIQEDVADRIAEGAAGRAGISRERLLLACSHSHCAPVASLGPRTRRRQRRYVEGLIQKVVDALAQAAADLRPAGLTAARGTLTIAVNRRAEGEGGEALLAPNPDGPVDRDLNVLQVRAEDGVPIATVLNAACHPTIQSPKQREASAGWPGIMRRRVEEATGAPALFLQGATGDLNPDHEWEDGDDQEALDRLGARAGEEAVAALDHLAPVKGTPLAAGREAVDLRLVPERDALGLPVGYRRGLWRHAKVPPALSDLLLDLLYPWRTRVRRDGEGALLPVEVTALRLGDVAVAAHGAETFHALGRGVKEASPAAAITLFAGYANGMVGYLPTLEEHARGGYEVDVAPYVYRLPGRLPADGGERVAGASTRLLASLWGSPG
ncbi:MAG: hypothetical protein ACQEXJ_23110 [Myxococcota bacterium]